MRERTAATHAGFQIDDVTTKVNGTAIRGLTQFLETTNSYQSGDAIDVSVQRDDRESSLFVILGARLAGYYCNNG